MIKYLCALSILFSGCTLSATNTNDMGLFRDNNYNILALAGGYNCSVYRIPNDLSEFNKYGGSPIGTAKLEVTPYADYSSSMVNIVFDTGTVITSPKLPLNSTGSEATVYFSENAGALFAYMIYDTMGVKVIVQNNNKGKEISIGLADCKYDKAQ
ncbi:hypothetical protein [Providencia sp. PROV212]|uniref:hypothetical protein n=1 Tax=Providencia sp. PROV212 TaxID=2949909 RepID=UPI00234AD2B9|nr:hypothetical protein [Providencia sp. PROV212]